MDARKERFLFWKESTFTDPFPHNLHTNINEISVFLSLWPRKQIPVSPYPELWSLSQIAFYPDVRNPLQSSCSCEKTTCICSLFASLVGARTARDIPASTSIEGETHLMKTDHLKLETCSMYNISSNIWVWDHCLETYLTLRELADVTYRGRRSIRSVMVCAPNPRAELHES
jgi:hypothetical protein